MAGDWIKMRTDLAEDPAVIAIALATGVDEDTVVGKLHRLWSWADRQTTTGNASRVSFSWVDRYLRVDGFAKAMSGAKWLDEIKDGIRFPKFVKHNGDSSKKRLLTAKRVAKHKAKNGSKGNASVVSGALPTEQNRTEQKTEDECSLVRSFVESLEGVVRGSRKEKWEFEIPWIEQVGNRHIESPASICAIHRNCHRACPQAVGADEKSLVAVFHAALHSLKHGKRSKHGMFKYLICNPSKAKLDADELPSAKALLALHRERISADREKFPEDAIPLCDTVPQ